MLAIHVLAVYGLIRGVATAVQLPDSVVTAIILPRPEKPPPPVLPVPKFTPARPAAIVAIIPLVTIKQPPPPDAIIARPSPPTQPTPPQAGTGQTITAAPDYLSQLVAHLNAFKHYPYASGTHAQGTVRLHFVMARDGHLISYQVVGSSGSPALDQAARDLIKAAEPLPPVPDKYPGTVLDLVVPINYTYVVR